MGLVTLVGFLTVFVVQLQNSDPGPSGVGDGPLVGFRFFEPLLCRVSALSG